MSKGYVYILTNPSMPSIVKIGKTTRTPQQRCDELWQTGVPTPFKVHAQYFSPDCHALERDVHLALSSHRVSSSREFFTIWPSEADEEVRHWHLKQIERMVGEFLPLHAVVLEEMALDEAIVRDLAADLGVHPFKAVRALEMAIGEEIAPALARLDERLNDIIGESDDHG